MSAIIRKATREDIPAIVEMARRFYPSSGYSKIGPMVDDQAIGLAIITMDTGVMLVAEEDGQLVAMASLHIDHFIFNIDIKMAHELVFWIEPEHRGGMLAVRMLKAAERAVLEAGATWNRMATLPGSPEQAAALYERMGYVHSESYYVKAL